MSSHKSRNDEIYEKGVHDGQQADAMDQVFHSLSKGFTLNPRENEIYNTGYAYGVAHRPQRPARPDSESSVECGAESEVPASDSAGDGASLLDAGDGNPIAAVCTGIGVIWGLVAGFQAGGVWGAFWGAIFGMFAGYLAGLAATLAIGAAILFGFFWVAWHVVRFLWNLS
jgi:hypothetical protein